MENKLILRRVSSGSVIFGLIVFGAEEWMLRATDTVWLFVLSYGLAPIACVCKLFSTKTLSEMGALRQNSTYFLAANAFLWAILFALVFWWALRLLFPTIKSNENQQL